MRVGARGGSGQYRAGIGTVKKKGSSAFLGSPHKVGDKRLGIELVLEMGTMPTMACDEVRLQAGFMAAL